MSDVLVAGVAVADIVMRVDEMPRAAEKYRAADAAVTVGGCAANAAIAVARHGGHAVLAARIGGDLIGDLIAGKLASEDVDLGLCDRPEDAQSSFSSIFVDTEGERQIVNFRGRHLAETVDLAAAPRVAAVLTDNRWPPLTKSALAAARRWGVPGIVDAESPFEAGAVQGATHIAFSMQGLTDHLPGIPVDDALRRACAEFGAWVAVTDGANGVRYTQGDEVHHVPAFRVEAVDTLGAGDIWHGAFALRLAEGADEETAIRFANAAAALKCRAFGGVATCPHRDETEAFLKEQEQ